MTKKKKIILSIALVTILCVGIAYAYLTNTISSNVQVTVDKYKPLCKRASSSHTETCIRTAGGCNLDGITQNSEINYGKTFTGLSESPVDSLNNGDAFDCDVNGDGTYDAETERFYYITDLENDSKTAVLVYYSTVYGGVADQTTSYLYGSYTAGPTTARAQLPTTSQWKNVTLVKPTKRIRTRSDWTTYTIATETTFHFNQSFSYEGYAARLLTYQEIAAACSELTSAGGLKNCNYLLEETNYSGATNKITHILIQTPSSGTSSRVEAIDVSNSKIVDISLGKEGSVISSVKPAIEVPKARMAL